MTSIPVPKPGIYTPAITFFDPITEKIDLPAQSKYFTYLSQTGLAGLVVLGTNAETFLLTRSERTTLLKLARKSVPRDFPIIAGVSGHSNVQVLQYIDDAYQAGADFALLLPCAYFGKQTTPNVVKNFFGEIASVSPLPIVIYNFPGVCNGLDLDSELITEIVRANENVVGVKLTCGSVAKITRLAATFSPSRFAVLGGQSDFLVGGLAAGSVGCVCAFGNVFPKSIVRIYELWMQGRVEEAKELQAMVALAESPTKAGIANTKYAAAFFTGPKAGIVGAVKLSRPRRPYDEPSEATKKWIRELMGPLDLEEGGPVSQRQSRL